MTMKKQIALLWFLVLSSLVSVSQSLGGYPIVDYLVSAVHPDGCSDAFVTGPPDTTIWVNFTAGDVMIGTFGQEWIGQLGTSVILETGFHEDNYEVSLQLSTGVFTAVHSVTTADWIEIADVRWEYIGPGCAIQFQTDDRFIIPLNLVSDFGLSSVDTIVGVRVAFLATSGAPDLAGIYISSSCSEINLGSDTVLCPGETLVLDPGIQNADYQWQDQSAGPTFTVQQPGLYWVEVTTDSCIIRDSINVVYSEVPIASFTMITDNATVDFMSTSIGAVSWDWDFGDSSAGSSEENPSHTFSSSGVYIITLCVTSVDGCSDCYVDSTSITIGIAENSPNPVYLQYNGVSSNIQVIFNQGGTYDLTLFNTVGQVVYAARSNEMYTYIATNNLSKGVYFLVVDEVNGQRHQFKIAVQ